MNKFYLLLIAFSICGCAATAGVIERESIDRAKYKKELAECRQHAAEINMASDIDSSHDNKRLVQNCMRDRGYEY